MTEKHYGGASSFGFKGKPLDSSPSMNISIESKKTAKNVEQIHSKIEGYEELIKAGEIAVEAVKYAKSIVKKGMLLLELAEKIESKINELGGKPAFPVNLSINEIAAHATPSYDSKETAFGLLKVDIGVHLNGFIADTAFSVDLENSPENKKLIEAAESALKKAAEIAERGVQLRQIGLAIESSIKSLGFTPVQNLSGHSIEHNNIHAGMTIPNYDNHQEKEITDGVYAIEPFSTTGFGSVRDGKPSGIYHLEKAGNVRDSFAREVLAFIAEEYETLPFCSRWIVKKFGTRGLLALRQIEQAGLLHHYAQLIEKGRGKVAQAEHTIIITERDKVITTL